MLQDTQETEVSQLLHLFGVVPRLSSGTARSLAIVAAALAIAGLLALGPVRLSAQVSTATLQGVISDPSGAVISGAEVALQSLGTGTVRSSVTGGTGEYLIPSIQPGSYEISVSKAGFSKARQANITLEVGQVATLNLSLKLGNISETVEVPSSVSAIETYDTTLGFVLPREQVVDLPLNGRQFSQLLQLTPGTVPIDNSQNAGKAPNFGAGAASPAVNGQTNRSNLFFLDGMIASNPFFGGFSFSPSIDDIQEFKLQSHTDQAEYGQATGAIVSVVSLSGTNTYHGSVFEFFRNNVLDAQNKFAPTKLAYHQNQFGASFGGHIIKNKLFFFANYEGGRQVQPLPAFYTVPTVAERNGDFSGLEPNGVTPFPTIYDPSTFNPVTFQQSPFPGNKIPVNAGMQAYLNGVYPLPNFTPTAANTNNYYSTNGNRTTGDQGSIRVDYIPGTKDSINGRYSQNDATLSSASSLANTFVTGFNGKNLGGNWVHTYSPSLISQITVAWNNLNIPQGIEMPVDQAALFAAAGLGAGFNPKPGDTTVVLVPGFNLNGGSYSGFWNGAGPIGPMNTLQFAGAVSKVSGKHSMKFGASFYRTWMYTNWNGNNMDFSNKGSWNAACQFAATNPAAKAQCPTYNATATDLGGGGDPVASMLLSLPIDATRNLGNSGVNLRQNTIGVFAQDSWRLTQKLTLSYGLRWDFYSPTTEADNRLATYDIYNRQYSIVQGDVDLPSGPLPPNVVVLSRRSIAPAQYYYFQPRLGLAYQLHSGTVVRAGAGSTYDVWGLPMQVAQNNRGAWPSGIAQQAATQPVNVAGITLKPDGTPVTGQNPFYGPAVLPPTPLPAGGLGFQDVRWKPAVSWQWNVEVEQDMGRVGNLSMAYVGSQTAQRTYNFPYNLALPSTTPYTSAKSPDQIFGGVGTDLMSGGTARYNSLQVKLTRAFANGFAYNAAFTWGMDNAFASCNGEQFNLCIQNPLNPRGDYGPSMLSIPLIFTFNGTYQLPFGKGQRYVTSGFASAIVGNWQINAIIAARSGQVINPQTNAGDVANQGGGLQRASYVSNPNVGAPHQLNEWFNTAAFVLPASGTFGNAGINSLRGPDYKNVDFSVFRNFPFTERFTLQFRCEFFNIFNHPNLGNPNNSFGSSSFNTITSTVSGPGANRVIQFGAKLLF